MIFARFCNRNVSSQFDYMGVVNLTTVYNVHCIMRNPIWGLDLAFSFLREVNSLPGTGLSEVVTDYLQL